MLVMTVAAVVLGVRNRKKGIQTHNRVLMLAAILMNGVEIIKVTLMCTLGGNPTAWLYALPLFLCSIQFITLPVAALSRGRLKEATLDFIAMFGLLGAVMGTYCAGNNYAAYPVLSLDNVASGITHSVAGFASLYIIITGIARMKMHNFGIACIIILLFSIAAWIANLLLGTNYMFLTGGDGTPYDILYQLVSGHPVLYPLGVVGLFFLYIFLCYQGAAWVRKARRTAKENAVGC